MTSNPVADFWAAHLSMPLGRHMTQTYAAESALPRCPSCGSNDIVVEPNQIDEGYAQPYALCAGGCGATGPKGDSDPISAFTNPAHALVASRAEVERLKGLLCRLLAATESFVAAHFAKGPIHEVLVKSMDDAINATRAEIAAQRGGNGPVG